MTVALRTVRAVRDDVVRAHQLALDSGDAGRLATRLYKTSSTVGNYYAQRFRGVYNPNITAHYLQAAAVGQLQNPMLDGLGSATQSSNFGVREFARQNPGRAWLFVWRHFPSSRSRPTHVDAGGITWTPGDDPGIVPPMGSPHCGCIAELQEQRTVIRRSNSPRVQVRGEPNREYARDLRRVSSRISKEVHSSFNSDTRWDGTIKVADQAHELVQQGSAAGVMEWDGRMSLSYNAETRIIAEDVRGIKVLVHELGHSYSKITGAEYSTEFGPALEEGATECFARSYMLENYGVSWESATVYEDFVRAWEQVRINHGIPRSGRLSWYKSVLQSSAEERARLFGTTLR